jgi:hypothetical protein
MTYSSWSVVFGEQPSATKWNILGTNDAHFYSFLGDNTAWQDWSPSYTNLSGGTTNYAKYAVVGKSLFVRFKYQLAGAGVAGSVSISTPVTLDAEYSSLTPLASQVQYYDSSTGDRRIGLVMVPDTTHFNVYSYSLVDTDEQTIQALSGTEPFSWAANDEIMFGAVAEAA